MALKLWNLNKIFVVLQWTIGTCSISLETNISPHWSHLNDQLPLQKMAEACILDIRWELNFASYVLKKMGCFENIFRGVWAKFKIPTHRNFEKMPTIDTLDALGDVMTTILTTILTTNLAQEMPQIIDICPFVPKFAKDMQKICQRYTKRIFKYAQDIH